MMTRFRLWLVEVGQSVACRFGRHAWGPLVAVPFFQEEIDVRFCSHCKAQEPFVVPARLSLGGHRES